MAQPLMRLLLITVAFAFLLSVCNATSGKRMTRAADKMTADDKNTLVNVHNELRAKEGASDMEIMVWDNYLEKMAAEWVDGCSFSHGNPPRDKSTMPYDSVGQNLRISSRTTMNLTEGVHSWYNEKKYYNFEKSTCSKSPCGHYTQVVWSTSRAIGCAWKYCTNLKQAVITKGVLLVCNYGPAGNRPIKPYKKGSACTHCPSGHGWCHKKLCKRGCSAGDSSCECKAACTACGVLDKSTCHCDCKNGWMGADCGEVCADQSKTCNDGWYPSWCTSQRQYVLDSCPLMCGLCKAGNGTCAKDNSAQGVIVSTTLIYICCLWLISIL